MSVRILQGDNRDVLKTLPDGSVHCCVTSPPYFGLRDYGCDGQLGLEATPEAYVASMVEVFREVRRVLRDDATLWLNLGDSYASGAIGGSKVGKNNTLQTGSPSGYHSSPKTAAEVARSRPIPPGLKAKDLIGIPWAIATALRDPYYTGRMGKERDRAWLAAMLDGEGTICGFHHIRADDGSPRTGAHITITNSNIPLLDEAQRIWPTSRSEHQRPGAGHLGKRTTYRWIVHGSENKLQFLREIYPYLIAKKKRAMVAYNLLLMFADAKSVGHSTGRDAARDKRAMLVGLLSDLNQLRPADLPSWLIEPPSVFEPGYYLRQDIIWSKLNPMPESVTDRCTKAHEYLFLLSKSPRYHCDMAAIAEPVVKGSAGSEFNAGKTATHQMGRSSDAPRADSETRNKRSVWEVATQPYSEAHFATFPPALIEPCIKAGCPEGGTVLDPFGGAGTTGLVADRQQRSAILIELNPAYVEIAQKRIVGDAPLFVEINDEHARACHFDQGDHPLATQAPKASPAVSGAEPELSDSDRFLIERGWAQLLAERPSGAEPVASQPAAEPKKGNP